MVSVGLCCCMWAFSSCGEQGLIFIAVAQASHCRGFSCCGALALDRGASVVASHGLSSWASGLVVQQHVGSSLTRDQTLVPCVGRQTPNHCTPGKPFVFNLLRKCPSTEHLLRHPFWCLSWRVLSPPIRAFPFSVYCHCFWCTHVSWHLNLSLATLC